MADGTARRSPSMYDVADRAGVSHQTVSRVVNGFDNIRPETRDRVLTAISELGYRRNSAARTLATRRSGAIGVLAPAVSDYGPTSTVQSIDAAARAAGFHPLITTTPDDLASIAAGLEFLLDQSVEALVVVAPQHGIGGLLQHLDVTVPIATLQSGDLGPGTAISFDQSAGAALAMAHLRELGHHEIQHVAGPEHFFEAEARRRSYERALDGAGIPIPEIVAGDWTAESGYRAARAIAPQTTAVFSANDQMALGLIHAFRDAGLDVPRDVSVVGFDDIPEAAHFWPPLTTVRQDFAEIGRRAVALLLGELRGELSLNHDQILPELIVRESTAPPDL